MSKLLYEGSKATFLEDVEMLEGVDHRAGGSLEGLIDITTDAAQLQARRLFDTMIEAEQDSTPIDAGGIANRSDTYVT